MTLTIFILKFFLWVVIAFGITQIVVESSIFDNFRRRMTKVNAGLGKVFNCVLCFGVWISFLLSIALWSPSKTIFFYDVVNISQMQRMEMQLYYDSAENNSANVLITLIVFNVKDWIYKLSFIFLDGMLGSACIWFLHILERRMISSLNRE